MSQPTAPPQYQLNWPRGGGGDAGHSLPHSADIKNEERYSTTSDSVFMAIAVTNIPLRLMFALSRITFVTELYFGLYVLVCNT